jgi:hypothetical protein
MRKSCLRDRCALVLGLALPALAAIGCGEDELSDEAYGAVDLAPYFYDGSTSSNPTSGLPRNLIPRKGWVDGKRAEYYDFGLVANVRKRDRAGGTTSTPDYAPVHPMWFFFGPDKRPLFGKPVKEARTGIWHMRGGKDVLNPNPRPDSKRNVPYSIRVRNVLGDFQRPIVSITPHQSSQYTGLWEIVEVITPDNYDRDSIKHDETLARAVKTPGWSERRTGKVINCPMVDDRTYVTPSPLSYNIPRPRMEIWYRTKLGSCYLINGIETLGDVVEVMDKDDPMRPIGVDVALYGANQDSKRLDTFDIIRYTIGTGDNERRVVIAPVGIVYDPVIRVVNQDRTRTALDIRYTHDSLSDAIPRHFEDDPPGYRPVKWHWDLEVPQDPPYQASRFKRISELDPAMARARSGGPWTRNFPIIGQAISCLNRDTREKLERGTLKVADGDLPPMGADRRKIFELDRTVCDNVKGDWRVRGMNYVCNEYPDLELAVSSPLPGSKDYYGTMGLLTGDRAGKDDPRLTLQFEGGPRCDVPAVGFGEFCAPGIARCDAFPPSAEETENKKVAGLGGYTCHPNPVGYCFLRCDSEASPTNDNVKFELDYEKKTATGGSTKDKKEFTLPTDSRCGAKNMAGYTCQSNTAATGYTEIPTRLRVCLRACNSRNTDGENEAICKAPFRFDTKDIDGNDNPPGNDGKPASLPAKWTTISPSVVKSDITRGTKCMAASGPTACIWDPAYEPRDPNDLPYK